MIYIFGAISIISFIVSVGLNFSLFMYIRDVTNERDSMERDLFTLEEILHSFQQETERVSGMELYAGDITIRNLLKNATKTREQVEEFIKIYYLEDTFENTPKNESESQ